MSIVGRFVVRRRLVAAVGVVGAITALARLLAAGREVAFAGRFGASSSVDAYFVALALPTIVTGVVASSVQAVVLPRYVVALQVSTVEAARLLSATVKRVAAVSILLAGLLLGLTPLLLRGFGGEFDKGLAFRLVATMLPTVVLGTISATLAVPFLARRKFLAFGAPQVVNAAVALCLLLATPHTGVLVAACGLALGSAAEFGVVLALHRRTVGNVLQESDTLAAGLHVGAFAGVAFGVAVANVNPFVDQLFVSRMPEGSIAALGYASRLMALVLIVPSLAIANAVAPLFAELYARGDVAGLSSSLRHQTKVILVVGLAVAGIVAAVATSLVALVLEQGRFDAAAAADTTSILRVLVWQLPFYMLTVLYARVLIVVGRGSWLPRATLLGLGVNIVGDLVLGDLYGLRGIAFTSVTVQMTMFGVLAHVVRRTVAVATVDGELVVPDTATVSL